MFIKKLFLKNVDVKNIDVNNMSIYYTRRKLAFTSKSEEILYESKACMSTDRSV